MGEGAWVLSEPLEARSSEDHPYLGTALAALGSREISVHYAPEPPERREFRVFLDGQTIYEQGMTFPSAAWGRLCRDLGFDPERHWDLDAALILFRQVLPAMTEGWKEHVLPYDGLGVPEGVICLASVQEAWGRGVRSLRDRAKGTASELVAECFERLPLRSLTFHDDPRDREDFVGNHLDEPFLGVFARLGSQSQRVTLSKATLHAAGGMKWSPWQVGGDWKEGDREFRSTRDPEMLLRAAGLDRTVPGGFREALQEGLERLTASFDPVVEEYREAQPVGVPWHRDPRTRYLNHMIVDVRLGKHPVLVLDDGTEVTVMEPH